MSPPTKPLQILIPLYNYPTWYNPPNYLWDDVAGAASQVSITAVINPKSGPGSGGPNSDYQHGLTDLRNGGVTILGYTPTSYTARSLVEVKTDVDQYRQYFNIDGIFFDEVSSTVKALPYYEDLYDYVETKSLCYQVFLNPGTQMDEGYLSQADTVVIFEGPSDAWPAYVPPPYVCNYSPDRFAALIYDIREADTMRAYIDLAVSRCIGYVYVTDDTQSNPWDGLPSYWEAEVSYIKSLNHGTTSSRSCLYLPRILKKSEGY